MLDFVQRRAWHDYKKPKKKSAKYFEKCLKNLFSAKSILLFLSRYSFCFEIAPF